MKVKSVQRFFSLSRDRFVEPGEMLDLIDDVAENLVSAGLVEKHNADSSLDEANNQKKTVRNKRNAKA